MKELGKANDVRREESVTWEQYFNNGEQELYHLPNHHIPM